MGDLRRADQRRVRHYWRRPRLEARHRKIDWAMSNDPWKWIRLVKDDDDDDYESLTVEQQRARASLPVAKDFSSFRSGWKSLKSRSEWFKENTEWYRSEITRVTKDLDRAYMGLYAHPLAVYCSCVEAEEAEVLARGLEEGLDLKDVCPVEQISVLLEEAKEALTGLQEDLSKLQKSRRELTLMLEKKVRFKLGEREERLRVDSERLLLHIVSLWKLKSNRHEKKPGVVAFAWNGHTM